MFAAPEEGSFLHLLNRFTSLGKAIEHEDPKKRRNGVLTLPFYGEKSAVPALAQESFNRGMGGRGRRKAGTEERSGRDRSSTAPPHPDVFHGCGFPRRRRLGVGWYDGMMD
jgi:hypothetical protein